MITSLGFLLEAKINAKKYVATLGAYTRKRSKKQQMSLIQGHR